MNTIPCEIPFTIILRQLFVGMQPGLITQFSHMFRLGPDLFKGIFASNSELVLEF